MSSPESGPEKPDGDTHANPVLNRPIPSHRKNEDKDDEYAQARPRSEQQSKYAYHLKRNKLCGIWQDFWAMTDLDRKIELFFALAISVFAGCQVWVALDTAKGNTAQTDQLIAAAKYGAYASNQNAQAARNFADSAASINNGIEDAVDRLGRQANSAQQSADASRVANQTAQKQMEVSERPYIKISNVVPKAGLPWSIDLPGIINGHIGMRIDNIGKSPAQIVSIELHLSGLSGDLELLHKSCTGPGYRPNSVSVVFAGDHSPEDIGYPVTFDIRNGDVSYPLSPGLMVLPASLLGCIQYKSPFFKQIYYTGIFYHVFTTAADRVRVDSKTGYISVFPDQSLSGLGSVSIPTESIYFVPESGVDVDIK